MKMRHAATLMFLAVASCQPAEPVFSRNIGGQWDATADDVKKWFGSLKQPDNGISCCGEADAYYADSFEAMGDQYVAIVTDERDIKGRPPIPVGTKIIIPNNKLKFDQGNPTGHGIVFVQHRDDEDDAPNNGWHVFCYVTPGGI